MIADFKEDLAISGKEKAVLNLAEGIALANYQFNKFFTKPKTNVLKTILVNEELNDDKIEELNNTIKSVYWVRNVVNTPVSHLNAIQLSEEVVNLGK